MLGSTIPEPLPRNWTLAPVSIWMCCKKEPCKPGKITHELSRAVRKPDFCLCENKGADQLCRNCTADQGLCFRYMDNMFPFLLKYKISSFQPFSVTVQTRLCQSWSKTPKTCFHASGLNSRQKKRSSSWLFTSTTLYEEPKVCLRDTTHTCMDYILIKENL